ncbi:hypothetical protein [Actinoplanes sp. CA-252034]|uniref:hypothetical protein n=1 Tax=Actinoplanes sp. CA-252034 TaxID=3239906 RepID=UPI003D975D55
MPTTDNTGRNHQTGLLDACERLVDLQYRLASNLHTLGLLTDTTQLTAIARMDQAHAAIDHARHTTGADQTPG